MTPWTVALQAPVSMGFPRQEYWSGLPFPSPGDLPGDPKGQTSVFIHALYHVTSALKSPTIISYFRCVRPKLPELFMTFHNLIPPLLSEDVSIIVVFYRSPSLL